MEPFQELLSYVGVTVFLSLLVSFVISKLLAMESSREVNGKTPLSVSVMGGAIEKGVTCKPQKTEGKSLLFDCKCEGRAFYAEQALKADELDDQATNVEPSRWPLKFIVDEIDSNGVVFNEFVGVGIKNEVSAGGLFDLGDLTAEELIVGGVDFADDVVDRSPERAEFRKIGVESLDPVEESSQKLREIEIESAVGEVIAAKTGDLKRKGIERDVGEINEEDGEEAELLFDDWEGVERTDLEKRFGDAVIFVGSRSNAESILSLDSDVKLQLYGLNKVALEGPCSVPQPMALKVSARAKWNAWQQLGDMSREVAMEQYIALLSSSIPEWKGNDAHGGK